MSKINSDYMSRRNNDYKWIIKEILNCGEIEVRMLAQTNIDIANTVQYINENGFELNMESLFYEAYKNKIVDLGYDNPNVELDERDFGMYYNGAYDTHIMINNGKYDHYYESCPELLEEIEKYMNMEFERGV